jgi:hypothetical protein
MAVNLAMWREATTQLVRIEKKSDGDAPDVVSKWLIATRSAVTTVAAILLAYAATLYAIAVPHFLTPSLLAALHASGRALKAFRRLAKPRPKEAPPGYPICPRWFSTVWFMHSRSFGNLFVPGVALDAALRFLLPGFWQAA